MGVAKKKPGTEKVLVGTQLMKVCIRPDCIPKSMQSGPYSLSYICVYICVHTVHMSMYHYVCVYVYQSVYVYVCVCVCVCKPCTHTPPQRRALSSSASCCPRVRAVWESTWQPQTPSSSTTPTGTPTTTSRYRTHTHIQDPPFPLVCVCAHLCACVRVCDQVKQLLSYY